MADSSDWQQITRRRRQDRSRQDERSSQRKPSSTTAHQIPVKREIRDVTQRYHQRSRPYRSDESRTYPVQNLVNETIYLNEKEHKLYKELNESGVEYIPYQSLDMINQRRKELADGVSADKQRVTVRFAKKADIDEYKKNKAAFEQIKHETGYRFDLKNGQYDLPSPIDIFKMQESVMSTEPNKPSTRKYLYQTDPQVREHAKRVNEVVERIDKDVGNPIDSKRNIIFIPYLPGTEIGTIETHSQYKNVSICNNREFVSKLKERFPDKKVIGTILRNIGRNMELYNQLTNDDLDTILERQKKNLYGLKKKDIAEYLVARNRALDEEVRLSKDARYTPKSNCKDIFDKMIDTLSESPVIDADMTSVNRDLRNCWARSLEFQELINHKIGLDEPKNSTYNVIYNFCSKSDMIFSPGDRFSRPTFYGCDMVIDSIKDPRLKQNMEKILTDKKIEQTNPYTAEMLSMDEEVKYPDIVPSFGEYYMPEWYSAMIEKTPNLKRAFHSRPLILGSFRMTRALNKCSLFSRSDPFVKFNLHLNDISYSTTKNQVAISCLLNRTDLIFPIHLYLPDVNSVSIYSSFDVNQNKNILFGSYLIRASGKRFNDKVRYYQVFVYYNKEANSTKLVNFRSNELIPGTVMEHTRAVYRELNTLMYSVEDLDVKLYWYKVRDDPNRYLISNHNISQIRDIYRKRFASLFENREMIEDIIASLIPCKIYKDLNKRFIIESL